MTPTFFIGVDISKLTLDIAVIHNGKHKESLKIGNTAKDVKGMLAALKTKHGCTPENSFFCAENMGLYTRHLAEVLTGKGMPICLDSALRIKRSMGIQRGKNDKVDAIRIGQYALRNFPSLKQWEAPRACIVRLKYLLSLRKKLVRIKVMLCNPSKLEQHFLSALERKKRSGYFQRGLNAIKADIQKVEKEMESIAQNDDRLNELLTIMTSIPRVGRQLALEMIIYTNEFKGITTPKKFASYCGIAPFPYLSGTSIKGRARVSPLANKELKTTIHLAAFGCMLSKDTMFAKYYFRKVEEGKNKMSVINAVRNKLVHVIFACVRNGTPYEEKPQT